MTVTFLEMTAPPAHLPPLPVHRQVALMKTRNMPLHFYRYLMDRVGRKWHWVNALQAGATRSWPTASAQPGRDIRVLYVDGAPAGFFDLKPHLPDDRRARLFRHDGTRDGAGHRPLVPGRGDRRGVVAPA